MQYVYIYLFIIYNDELPIWTYIVVEPYPEPDKREDLQLSYWCSIIEIMTILCLHLFSLELKYGFTLPVLLVFMAIFIWLDVDAVTGKNVRSR